VAEGHRNPSETAAVNKGVRWWERRRRDGLAAARPGRMQPTGPLPLGARCLPAPSPVPPAFSSEVRALPGLAPADVGSPREEGQPLCTTTPGGLWFFTPDRRIYNGANAVFSWQEAWTGKAVSFRVAGALSNSPAASYQKGLTAAQQNRRAKSPWRNGYGDRHVSRKVCTFGGRSDRRRWCFHLQPQCNKNLCTNSIYRSLS